MLVSQDDQKSKLESANASITNILGALKIVETSTTRIQASALARWNWSWNWKGWPYIAYPAVSLRLGSFRLAPSMMRNLLLVGIGMGVCRNTQGSFG